MMDSVRNRMAAVLVFAFLGANVGSMAMTRVWTGDVDTDWFTSGNWDSDVPAAGDTAIVPSGKTLLLTNATASLAAFSITHSTLMFSNWTSRLQADQIDLWDGGILTHAPVDTNAAPDITNRVYLVGNTIAIHSGAVLNADGQGFVGGTRDGQGPGYGRYHANRGSGAGYGGVGGDSTYLTAMQYGGAVYGAVETPWQPGSGGGSYGSSFRGGNGGGSIRIEAGHLILNGTLSVNGAAGQSQSGGGSGGGIWVTCTSLAATGGVISARGGNSGGNGGGAGGGGRLALDYQSVIEPVDIQYAATPGGNGPWSGWFRRTVPMQIDAAEMGSLFLARTNGWLHETLDGIFQDVQLVVPGFTAWSPSDLVMTDCRMRLEPGFDLNVTGALTIGASAVLAVFSNATLVSGQDVVLDGGELVLAYPARFECGGHLVLTNNAGFWLQSGPTNGPGSRYGCDAAVIGDIRIATGSWIHPYSHPVNGGSVRWRAANLEIASGGGIDANARGYGAPRFGNANGYGPGAGLYHANRGSGAGYGGRGSWSYWNQWLIQGGDPYGSSNAPVQAGSGGGGSTGGTRIGGFGGGLIWLEIENRAIVDGVLSANGGNGGYNAGGGSGGGIWIACDDFAGGADAVLSANGGRRGTSDQGGAGGGGRIAVAVGLSAPDREKLLDDQAVANLTIYSNHAFYTGAILVDPGLSPVGTGDTNCYALPGSYRFLTTAYTLTIAGDPTESGNPNPDGYGTITTYGPDARITNSVVSPADEAEGVRVACYGWTLRDDQGGLRDSGTGFQAEFNLGTNLVLTWFWTNEYWLVIGSASGGTATVERSGWYTNAVTVELTATADPGYTFTEWTGDVPSGQETRNPLSLIMDQPRAVEAQFASEVPMTRVWNGTNPWETTTNWAPAGMPAAADTAVIASGTARLAHPRSVAHLVVSNGATVLFTNWNTTLTATGQIVVQSNGTVRVAGPFTESQMSNRIILACQDLRVDTGGRITASGAGFAGTPGDGIGPGKGLTGARGSGGGHGGRGGDVVYSNLRLSGGERNGSPEAPDSPGSSGGGYDATRLGGHGGGVIRIEAQTAIIDGAISANGGNSGNWSGGGSGGSIFLSATTLSGNGWLTAAGGNGNSGGGAGSGGRVAVHYDSPAGDFPRFDASAGSGAVNGWVRGIAPPFGHPAEVGTLYLTRTNGWLGGTLTGMNGVHLIVPGFTNWTTPHLTVSNASIRLDPGFELKVIGSLVITGSEAALVQTGDPGFHCGAIRIEAGQLVSIGAGQFICQSDLMLTNGGRLSVKSAPANETDPFYGTIIDIAGDLGVGPECWIYPFSDGTNGGSVLVRAMNVRLDAGGGINADSRGYDGGFLTKGWGPGGGEYHGNRGSGGGHGGVGGWSYWTQWLVAGGDPYGHVNAPVQPGSGGGGVPARAGGGSGGGLVRIEAAGDLRLDGTIRANGGAGGGDCGGGSGGGITLICGGSFAASETARLEANGGNGSGGQGGGGGGGRIAVWMRQSPAMVAARLARGGAYLSSQTNSVHFLGDLQVNPGTGPALYPDPKAAAPGTIRFFDAARGTMFLIR